MKRKKTKLFLGLISCSLVMLPVLSGHSASHYKPPPRDVIAKLLGWVPTPTSLCYLCGGYFYEPEDIRQHPSPAPYKSQPTKVTAKGPTIFSQKGESILQDDVRVTQAGRLTRADKATIDRDNRTGKVSIIKLHGHVRMQEHGRLLTAKKGTLNLKNNTAELNEVAYKFTQYHARPGENASWGTAEKANRLSDGNLIFKNATYTTCSPLKPSWKMSAKKINVDQKKKRVTAKNAILKVWSIPVLFTPRISFSMHHDRKSGILSPLLANSSRNGFTAGLPYYWNMAPNYDMTITPTYYTKRRFEISSLFRYLTESTEGKLYISYLPDDKEFQRFKNNTIAQFPNPENTPYQPYIDKLKKTHNYRGYFAYSNKSKFNDKWKLNAELNYVTDPYYLRDLGAAINDVIANQLLNQVDLSYEGMHWNFTILGQAYQTLHLIDEINTPTVNQYMRLPELDTSADYPNIFGGVDFNLSMQAVNFMYHSAFPPATNTLPIGQRFHLRPTFERPFNWAAGYLTPGISFDSTSYNNTQPLPGQARESSRNLPIFDLDSGLYFDRHFDFRQHDYIQTLEPRLFYLYVPYKNQDRFPVYDTQILPFTFDQLFAVNRFTGFDRLQNANQTSFGLTTRILNGDNANELLKADIGVAYYIDKPKVCLSPGCIQGNEHWSPIATRLTFHPTPSWSIGGNFSWDPKLTQTNNVQVNVSYTGDGRHIIGAGYTFVHAQPASPIYSMVGFNNNSALYKVYLAWPLSTHWSTLGYFYYNATEHHPESYFAGLQYDSCCIALRLIVNRTFQGTIPQASGTRTFNQYNTSVMFQIQLKGIGSAGNSNPYSLLVNDIPGYHDAFRY